MASVKNIFGLNVFREIALVANDFKPRSFAKIKQHVNPPR
jgi:hypothetical protein